MAAAAPRPSAPNLSPDPHHVLIATELLTGVEAAAQARVVLGDLLRQGHRTDLLDTACLLASELVANAVVHADAPIELIADLDRDRLKVQVIDGSAHPPTPRSPDPLDTRGRGLDLVDRISDSWGVAHVSDGKSVWFALRT